MARSSRRPHFETDTPDPYPEAVRIAGHPGIAWYVLGWETEPDADTEWTGEEVRTGRLVCIMVGDDRRWVFDPEDVQVLAREDYCGSCGQIGCGHDGFDSDGGPMNALRITADLRAEIQGFYQLRAPICNADVRAEYKALARRGLAGIAGDARREALRGIFARHGADPVHGQTVTEPEDGRAPHVCRFGPFAESRFAGTWRRECTYRAVRLSA